MWLKITFFSHTVDFFNEVNQADARENQNKNREKYEIFLTGLLKLLLIEI